MRVMTSAWCTSLSIMAAATTSSEKVSPQIAGRRPSPTPRLCAAIVDRLTYGGTIIETGTDSYRLAQTRAQAGRHI